MTSTSAGPPAVGRLNPPPPPAVNTCKLPSAFDHIIAQPASEPRLVHLEGPGGRLAGLRLDLARGGGRRPRRGARTGEDGVDPAEP